MHMDVRRIFLIITNCFILDSAIIEPALTWPQMTRRSTVTLYFKNFLSMVTAQAGESRKTKKDIFRRDCCTEKLNSKIRITS